MDTSTLWAGINGTFSDIAITAVIALFGWLSNAAVTWMKKHGTAAQAQAEQDALGKAKDTLHSALTTGVQLALSQNPNANPVEIIRVALAYAQKSSPDAIALLKPSGEVLLSIAVSKIVQALPSSWQDLFAAHPEAVVQATTAVLPTPPAAQ